jgi:folate-binding protein YgfZ
MTPATESSAKTTDNFGSGLEGSVPLAELGVVRVRGPDALTFLQGQLSCDVMQLTPERALLGGYHNPQGRVIALLRLLAPEREDVLAILPRSLAPMVAHRLSRFILRAKVKISDESALWHILGISAASAPATLPQVRHAVLASAGTLGVHLGGEPARWLWLASELGCAPPVRGALGERTWRSLCVAAGEPQVYPSTSEAFVAQMLNLDALGGIAFEKGCYTGQEVIARAHYRGRVKRRLQRFRTLDEHSLEPGDSGILPDGRAFQVVEAARQDDGRCEFLAVAPREAESVASPPAATLSAAALPLPYPLPE